MTVFSNEGMKTQEFVYDFAVDGGVKDAAIALSSKDGKSVLPVGAIIEDVTAHVITAIVGSSSTLAWGNLSDADGYSGTTIAEASLTINSMWNGASNAAPLLWDDTNDHMIPYRVADANGGDFNVLISTADLTAGKVLFLVKYYMPSVVS